MDNLLLLSLETQFAKDGEVRRIQHIAERCREETGTGGGCRWKGFTLPGNVCVYRTSKELNKYFFRSAMPKDVQ